ncbi:hypothetical protein U1Q18_011885, partial [Sarracenia purpurea var. burkii]
IQTLQTDKAELRRDLKDLNEKLSSAVSKCNAKDDLVEKHAKMVHEALAGWEKAEAEVVLLKQELDEVLRQRIAGEERQTDLDMALKECMQQLRFVREEQEQRIHDAMMNTSKEFEKVRIVLEEKLIESKKRLSKLGTENTQLSKALLAKEKMIDDFNEQRNRADADFNALMTRLESIEKENASLKYEVRVLEKELEIRNEEREFTRRTSDVAHKQHLESVKKIAKLESECQRLRLLVRKRLPGPAALAKMKNEVEMLSGVRSETRRRKSNPSLTGSMDFVIDNVCDTLSKRIDYLTERLCSMEEENKSLKETLDKKTNELQYTRIMCAHNASKSQVEGQLEESSIGLIAMEPERHMPIPHEISWRSMSDMGSEDKVSCSESWASALISELEHFRNSKQMGTASEKTVGASELDLMDDFVEMEKLAIVSMDKQFGISCPASIEGSETVDPLVIQSGGDSLAASGAGLGPTVQNEDIPSKNILVGRFPSWLQDILKVVVEQNKVTRRKPNEILDDIKVALQHITFTNYSDFVDSGESLNQFNASSHSGFGGCICWKPQDNSPSKDSANRIIDDEVSVGKKSNRPVQSNLRKSICKTIELIEGINLPSLDYSASEILPAKDGNHFPYDNPEAPSGYMVRVLQWKTSELGAVLQQFVRTCNDLLIGSADVDKFVEELTSSLDWVMNHCFSLQDVSSMRDAIKKQFDWDESRSESELEFGTISQFSESNKSHAPQEQLCHFPVLSAWSDHKMEDTQCSVGEVSRSLKDKVGNAESANKELEGRLRLELDKSKLLMIKLEESEKIFECLQTEVATLKELNGVTERQIESQKLVNEDLNTQLKVARVELNEVRQRCSYLETELENKSKFCEALEATCLDLQLHLECGTKKEIPNHDDDQEEKKVQTDLEITAASEKLAECQDTILNLGKQLKALASPRDATLFDNLISNPLEKISMTTTTPKKSISQRSSLLDKMLAEDNAEAGDLKFLKTIETVCISDPQKPPQERFLHINGIKHDDNEAVGGSLAVLPGQKKGSRGLLKKLSWRRNKGK